MHCHLLCPGRAKVGTVIAAGQHVVKSKQTKPHMHHDVSSMYHDVSSMYHDVSSMYQLL